jgi:hypothetical protein
MLIKSIEQIEKDKIVSDLIFKSINLEKIRDKLNHIKKISDIKIFKATLNEANNEIDSKYELLNEIAYLNIYKKLLFSNFEIKLVKSEFNFDQENDRELLFSQGPKAVGNFIINEIDMYIKLINEELERVNKKLKYQNSEDLTSIKVNQVVTQQSSNIEKAHEKLSLTSLLAVMSATCCFVALLDMPDEFYVFLKFLIVTTCILMIVKIKTKKEILPYRNFILISLGIICVIFNPILPLNMERFSWAWVNILSASLILYFEFHKTKSSIAN